MIFFISCCVWPNTHFSTWFIIANSFQITLVRPKYISWRMSTKCYKLSSTNWSGKNCQPAKCNFNVDWNNTLPVFVLQNKNAWYIFQAQSFFATRVANSTSCKSGRQNIWQVETFRLVKTMLHPWRFFGDQPRHIAARF